MRVESFKVGQRYSWAEISEFISIHDIEEEHDYGEEFIGTNAIHIRTVNLTDLWFVLDYVMGTTYKYELVYKK